MDTTLDSSINKNISIFGESWPEVNGLANIYQCSEDRGGGKYYSLIHIRDCLRCYPDKEYILIIQPHNYAYFLYRLAQEFSKVNIKIICDKLYLSDIVILKTLGFTDATTFDTFTYARGTSHLSIHTSQLHPLPSWDELHFLKFINKTIINQLHEWGLTPTQRLVLALAVKGVSNSSIGQRLKIKSKTVSTHKLEALRRLPYGNHRFALTRGLQAQYPR